MVLKIFSIYDSKLESYLPPFVMRTNAEAIRWFIDLVNSGKSELGIPSHPEDYTLFEIGSFEESNGDIDVLAAKVSLGLALNFVKPVGNGG